jgi:hypothetical protein
MTIMKAKELILDVRVARVLNRDSKHLSVQYGKVAGRVATRKNYKGKETTFAIIEFEYHYGEGETEYNTEDCPIEELISEAEGKVIQAESDKKFQALEDEFQVMREQVLEKCKAAALLVDEVNALLKDNRELSSLYYEGEVGDLRNAMRSGGWVVSTSNC